MKFKVLVQRFLAFGLDVSVVSMLTFALLYGVRLVSPAYEYHALWKPSGLYAIDALLVVFFKLPLVEPMLLSLLYVVVSTKIIRGTLGMWAFDLQMQCSNGMQPSALRVGIRHVLSYVSLLAFGLGYLWALIDGRGRTVHDIASGVIVDDRVFWEQVP